MKCVRPLTGLFGVGDYVFDELPDDSPLKDFKNDYESARERMLKLVDDAFLLTNINVDSSAFRLSGVRVQTVVAEALSSRDDDYAEYVSLPASPAVEHIRIRANPTLLYRACSDLLNVATMCVEKGQQVCIDTVIRGQEIAIAFITSGPALPPESLESFFDVGGQRSLIAPGGDFGLRTALAAHIVELFNGRVSVSNGKKGGIVIEAIFPAISVSNDLSADWNTLGSED